jgi:transposase
MLTKEDYAVIKALTKRGVYQKDIAAELGVHPKTISRALQRGAAPSRPRSPRPRKLDPYKPRIDQVLGDGVWNAVVIFRALRAAGYTGQLTMLRAYIAPKRALRPSRATVRFETEPGYQLQSDWGATTALVAGQPTTVQFIVNQLAFSRRFHFWCTT